MSSVYDDDVDKGDESADSSRRASAAAPEQNATTQPTLTSGAKEAQQPPPLRCDDWDSPNDPGNATNWSFWKKVYHPFIPASIAFVCTLGSRSTRRDEDIMRDLRVSREILPGAHWVAPVAAEAVFGCGNLLVFMSATLSLRWEAGLDRRHAEVWHIARRRRCLQWRRGSCPYYNPSGSRSAIPSPVSGITATLRYAETHHVAGRSSSTAPARYH